MTRLHDVIAAACRDGYAGIYHFGKMADAVLDTPDMQSVKAGLYVAFVRPYVETLPSDMALDIARDRMEEAGLLASVIEWVLIP